MLNTETSGMIPSSSNLLGFIDLTKNGRQAGWVEERNSTKDIGMLNLTYE